MPRIYALDAITDAFLVRAGVLSSSANRLHPVAEELVEDKTPILRNWVCHYGMQQKNYKPAGTAPNDMAVFAAGLTSGSFAQAFSDHLKKVVFAGMAAHTEYRAICKPVPLPDFRLTEFPLLDIDIEFAESPEGAELRNLTPTETSGHKAGLATFGCNIGINRELLINDDVEFLASVFRNIGASAARREAARVYACLEANANLKDGQSLFSAGAGNLEAFALDEISLASALKRLRNLATPGGSRGNYEAASLVVAPDIELAASKLLFQANLSKIQLIVGTWLAEGRWYLAADPEIAPSLALLHLGETDGAPQVGPVKQKRVTSDNLAVGVRHDFNVIAIGRGGIIRGGL